MAKLQRRRIVARGKGAARQAQRQRRGGDPNAALKADMKERLGTATAGQEKLEAGKGEAEARKKEAPKAEAEAKAEPAAKPKQGEDAG